MGVKRIISALILFPIVAIILIFGNKYIVDIALSIITIMCLYEYFKSFKSPKENIGITWIAYVLAGLISLIHIIPQDYLLHIIALVIPITILILFAEVIATNLKFNIKDISIVIFGIAYIVVFMMFISIIRDMINGRILIWFLFISAWSTDTFAYLIGKRWGKHKFTKISPNKSIEGCIAGIIGSIICVLFYGFICNTWFDMNFNYIYILLIAITLSLIGQLGDIAASSIKRTNNIKDFSNLIPGHGGMLDRIDSVIFIAPFAYFLLLLL